MSYEYPCRTFDRQENGGAVLPVTRLISLPLFAGTEKTAFHDAIIRAGEGNMETSCNDYMIRCDGNFAALGEKNETRKECRLKKHVVIFYIIIIPRAVAITAT